MEVYSGFHVSDKNVIRNPSDEFFKEFLKPYYVITEDGQYLFASKQKGRRPDRVFYMVPEGYKLGKGQRGFDVDMGKEIYGVVEKYARDIKFINIDGTQGEEGWETGIRVMVSIENPHSAYIAWMGKLMIFPPKHEAKCFNMIIPEKLPEEYTREIKEIWNGYNENEPLTLFDFTGISKDIRKVINLGIDYFGGAFKKPNLTMVWNRAEEQGLISYHAGCCDGRILKGLSGTGKTTLTVGKEIEQDDALVGLPIYENGKISKIKLIGLEAASFAKSEGLTPSSPEWQGLIASKKGEVVLAMNIDCEGVEYMRKEVNGHEVEIPVAKGKAGVLQCREYKKSGTTNGRFVFKFSILNKNWGAEKYLKAEGLSFRRYDIMEPMIRVTRPEMAVAFDSSCETIITSAIEGQRAGKRVRRYAATDFMAREQAEQAYLKLKAYRDLDLSLNGGLIFFVVNTGYIGAHDLEGRPTGVGEKITVDDTKKLIELVEGRKIRKWIQHPSFGYLIPHPKELEEHGLKNFSKRFNLLQYYSPEEIIEFYKRDIAERTAFLEELFEGQEKEEELKDVINIWRKCRIPTADEVRRFYEENYE